VDGYRAGVTYKVRRDWLNSYWLANIPPFFGFQFGRRSWPRPWLLFDWL